jgi:hypothetical protein
VSARRARVISPFPEKTSQKSRTLSGDRLGQWYNRFFLSALLEQTKPKTPICNQRTSSWCNLVFQIVSKHMSMRIGGAPRDRSPFTTIVANTRMCKHVPMLNQSQTPQDESSFMLIGTQNKQIKS